ncbi:hypothetical protein KJ780_00945, partial [Candidatus Micrarchaeota archaeon]|nr:hypothetical protein [Candidatus Micrarchaeota archaeon]
KCHNKGLKSFSNFISTMISPRASMLTKSMYPGFKPAARSAGLRFDQPPRWTARLLENEPKVMRTPKYTGFTGPVQPITVDGLDSIRSKVNDIWFLFRGKSKYNRWYRVMKMRLRRRDLEGMIASGVAKRRSWSSENKLAKQMAKLIEKVQERASRILNVFKDIVKPPGQFQFKV